MCSASEVDPISLNAFDDGVYPLRSHGRCEVEGARKETDTHGIPSATEALRQIVLTVLSLTVSYHLLKICWKETFSVHTFHTSAGNTKEKHIVVHTNETQAEFYCICLFTLLSLFNRLTNFPIFI